MKVKMKRISGLMIGSLLFMAGIASAGEIENLTNTLAEKGILSHVEARQILIDGKEETRKNLAQGKIDTIPSWIQNVSMKGDLRLRHQVDWDSSKSFPRSRERMRLRVGFDTRIVDNVKAGFGIATGGEKISDKTVTGGSVKGDSIIDAEPSSTNHTFSNGFGKPVLMVDYAFLEYAPLSWLNVTAGKMKAGTHVWHNTDLLWDGDINPDGVAINLKKDIHPQINVFFTGSWLIFNELGFTGSTTTPPTNNPDAYIAQPGVTWNPSEKISVKAAVGYQVLNVNGKNTGYYGTPGFDYACLTPSANISVKEIVGPLSLGVFADTVSNSDKKPTSDTSGSAFGFRFGADKISEPCQWQVSFMRRRLEANSWLSKLGDSDAYGGVTNYAGNEAIITLGLTKSATLGIDYYSTDLINGATATTPKSLIQFDIVYKF